jgi:hypothetical protein
MRIRREKTVHQSVKNKFSEEKSRMKKRNFYYDWNESTFNQIYLKFRPATTKTPVIIHLLNTNMTNICTNPAYNEFPSDVFSQRSRSRGAIIIHVFVVLYMFYCLAVVCDLYFLPSLEECSQVLIWSLIVKSV